MLETLRGRDADRRRARKGGEGVRLSFPFQFTFTLPLTSIFISGLSSVLELKDHQGLKESPQRSISVSFGMQEGRGKKRGRRVELITTLPPLLQLSPSILPSPFSPAIYQGPFKASTPIVNPAGKNLHGRSRTRVSSPRTTPPPVPRLARPLSTSRLLAILQMLGSSPFCWDAFQLSFFAED